MNKNNILGFSSAPGSRFTSAPETEWESEFDGADPSTAGEEDMGCDDDAVEDDVARPMPSNTCFGDPSIRSTYITSADGFCITHQKKVNRIEFLSDIPPIWPVPRIPTAYILDLTDPIFDVIKQPLNTDNTSSHAKMPFGTLINNKVSSYYYLFFSIV